MSKEIIVKMTDDHIKIKDGEYVRDIIRCKECKWYKQSETFCENGNGLWQAGDNCFCSYGERKESE